MLLPYNTDAPIYHFPYTTICLIVVNTLVYFITTQVDPEQVEPWILIFGDGLHPLQWVTNNFLHGSFMHLLGNMFYLWGFGLIVEGKLGWFRMLLVYLAIGVIYGAILQIAMLGSYGGAIGASGVIFGLMAISLVWAPKNEISCFLWILFHPITFDVSIIVFATSFLAWQLLMATMTSFNISSEVLHLTGAGVGAVFGVALLKLNLVDCEGWDLFVVWQGKEGKQSEPKLPDKPAPEKKKPRPAASQFDALARDIKNSLLGEDPARAAVVYAAYRKSHPEWTLQEADLMLLIRGLHDKKLWSPSIRPMVDYLQQFPERSSRMRLKLAQILISAERRPVKALDVLAKIEPASLSADLQATHKKLLAKAEAVKAECELEVADDDNW